VASRKGGQVWAAYKVGYPTANRIRLWHVGTKQGFTVSSKDVRRIALMPGLNGRLWLAWTVGSGIIKVARTNTAVTRIGAVRSLRPPTKRGSYSSTNAVAGTGLGGALHLLVNAQIGSAAPQIWYQRVPPGLTVNASPGKLSSGRLTVKVTDAGSPVSGAKVVFRGSAKKTSGNGTVVFRGEPFREVRQVPGHGVQARLRQGFGQRAGHLSPGDRTRPRCQGVPAAV